MKALLLCGYRALDPHETALGLECDPSGLTLIDRRIDELQSLNMKVVTVLGGETADEQLRHSRRIADTEMVFSMGRNLLSNVREGLFALSGEACFILPVEIPPPPSATWKMLLNAYAQLGFHTEECCLQTANCHFPLLLTRQGCQKLQDTTDLSSLVDARLKYLHLAP